MNGVKLRACHMLVISNSLTTLSIPSKQLRHIGSSCKCSFAMPCRQIFRLLHAMTRHPSFHFLIQLDLVFVRLSRTTCRSHNSRSEHHGYSSNSRSSFGYLVTRLYFYISNLWISHLQKKQAAEPKHSCYQQNHFLIITPYSRLRT